jgi:hypothetical protein
VENLVSLPHAAEISLRLVLDSNYLIDVAVVVVLLGYLETLTQWIPDWFLSNRAGFLKFAIGITGGIMAAYIVGSRFFPRRVVPGSKRTAMSSMMCGVGIAGLGLLVFALQYVRLLTALKSRLRIVAEGARKSWAAMQTPPASTTED